MFKSAIVGVVVLVTSLVAAPANAVTRDPGGTAPAPPVPVPVASPPDATERAANVAVHTKAPGKARSAPAASEPAPTPEAHPTAVTRPDESAAAAEAVRLGKPVEITSRRTESTSTLANPDGSLSLEAHAGPIRLRRGDGWVDVDTTLVRVGHRIAPRAAKGNVTFSAGGRGELASIASAQRRFAVSWPGDLPEPVLEGDTATYRDVLPGADLVLRATRLGYAQTLVLHRRPTAPLDLRMRVSATGLDVAVDAAGALRLTDPRGALVAVATTAEMWGAKVNPASGDPAAVAEVETRLLSGADGTVLQLRPDPAFLADPAVTYPVTIDPSPSLTLQGDTWVETSYVNTAQYSSTILKSGTFDGGGTKARSMVKFDVTSILGKNVTASTLKLFNYYSYSCNSAAHKRTDIYALTAGFNSSTVWTNQPAYTTAAIAYASFDYGYSSSCPGNWGVFSNMTAVAARWASRAQTNYGIVVRANNEADSLAWKKFYSQDHGTYIPYLQVTYNSDPNTPSSLSPANNAQLTSLTPTLSALVSDPDGGNVNAVFGVYNNATSATVYTNTNGSSVPSGGRSSLLVAAGKLAYGTTYRWRTLAKDPQLNYSASYFPTSGWYYFTVNAGTTKPSPPSMSVTPGNASAVVDWTEPADDGGANISGYKVYVYPGSCAAPPSSVTAFKYYSVSSVTRTQAVTGLTNGTSYCFAVTASNSVGESVADTALGTPHGLAQILKTAAGNAGQAQPVYAYGQTVTYTVRVTNPETAGTMAGVTVSDAIPEELDVASAAVWLNGVPCDALTCVLDNHNLSATLPAIAAGQSSTLTYQVTVPRSDVLGCLGALVNTATATNVAGTVQDTETVYACNDGLGAESWWSTMRMPLGPQAAARANVANGNVLVEATDATPVTAHGRLGLVLRRTYNSKESTLATLPGSLGAGWQFNVGQNDDLAGTGVGSTALYVPTADSIATPLGVTLIDRDGTRHVFRPDAVAIDALGTDVVASLRPILLGLGAGYTKLCVDQTYAAPKGVHLGMWRYIETTQGTCTGLTNGNSRLLGFAAVRTDRVRYEWAATGHLLSTTDGAGNRLDYLYDSAPAGVVTGAVAGITLNLGNLRAVYDPRACTATATPATLASLPAQCRALRLYYPSATEMDVYDAATRPSNAAGRGPTRYYFDTPAVGTPKHLVQVINPDDSANLPTLTTLDPASAATRPDRISYKYGAQCAGSGAGPHQLCSVSSQRNAAVAATFTYGTSASGLPGDTPRVSGMTDFRGTPTAFTYGASSTGTGTSTTVDTLPGQGTGTHRRVYDDIDGAGRVGKLTEGDAATTGPNTIGITYYTWDGRPDGVGDVRCQSPGGGLDNNLCLVQRIAGATSGTPDDETSFGLNDEGAVLTVHRCLNAVVATPHVAACAPAPSTNAIDETNAYRAQYFTTGGAAPLIYDDTIAGSGAVTPAPGRPFTGVLFAVSDRTASLTPRGNEAANAAVRDRFATTYRVDNVTTAAPGSFVAGGSFCDSAGNGTRNSGLICATDAPAFAAASPTLRTTTRYTFDAFGQRATMTTPKAIAEGLPGRYTYTYFADQADTDLSGSVFAGGWLKGVTDPAGTFVAFAYDAAGNPTRTWDRDATHGRTLAQFAGSGYTGAAPAPPYVESTYGTTAAPWRYVLSSTDQLGNRTEFTLDQHGNQTAIRPPRGTATSSATYDVVQVFDNGDLKTSVQLPEEAAAAKRTTYAYDAFGNVQVTTDPLGHVRSNTYDAKSRLTNNYTARGGTALPTGCSLSATAPVAGFPAAPSTVYCRTSVAYDMVDNPKSTTDASAQTTTMVYDGARRRTRTNTPRNDGTYSALRSETVYDADGHPILACPPRQFTDGGTSSCTTAGAFYSAHGTYDYAGRQVSRKVYRDALGSQPVTTTLAYDADGNTTEAKDARGVTNTVAFDVLGRAVTRTVPRNVDAAGVTTLAYTTTTRYSDAGDVIASFAPGTAADNPGVTGSNQTRVTGYAYDAAHRLLDTVAALQVSGSSPATTMTTDAITTAVAAAVSTPTTNRRTRTGYDADGHATAAYDPRAFAAPATPASPDPRYVAKSDYDRDGRPVLQVMPRYDTATVTDPNNDAGMSAQCGPGTVGTSHGYPSTVGVCRTALTYDAAGRVTSVQLPTHTAARTNRTIGYTYTDDNLLKTAVGPNAAADGSQTTLDRRDYDGVGRLTTQTNALNHATTTTYTSDGLVREINGPAGPGGLSHQSRYSYDANGNGVAITRPRTVGGLTENAATTMRFTADNLLAETKAPGSGVVGADFDTTTYGYDLVGRTTSIKSPAANAGDAANTAGTPAVNTFSADGLLLTTTEPVSPNGATRRRTSYAYDPAGRKTSTEADLVDVLGNVTGAGLAPQQLTYTPLDQIETQQGRNGTDCIRTTYDVAGNALTVADTRGASCAGGGTTTTHTASYYLDGLLRTTAQNGRTSAFSYDGAGAVTARADDTAAGRFTTTYTKGDAGFATAMNAPFVSGTATTWTYNALGQPTSQQDPNGQTVSWAYASDDTMTNMGVTSPGGAAEDTARYTYTYDEQFRKLTQTYTGKDATPLHVTGLPVTYSYAYDPAGRLSTFTNSALLPLDRTKTATWDHDGNRLTYGTRSFSYDADDSVAAGSVGSSDTPRPHTEDAEGRMTGDGCATYGYDGFDRLVGVTPTGAASCPAGAATYTYDGFDRQITRTDAGVTTSNYYSGAGATVLGEATAAGETGYVIDPAERAVAARRTGTGATTHYLTDDGTGSIATVTDANAAVACSARYNPFGESAGNTPTVITVSCNSGTTPSSVFYRGGRKDAATGNYQLGTRTYDPAKSSFLTPDSYRGGGSGAALSVGTDPLTANRYNYVNGDPVNYADPSGHRRAPDWLGSDSCDAKCELESRYASNRAVIETRLGKLRGQRTPLTADNRKNLKNKIAGLQAILDDEGAQVYSVNLDVNHGAGEIVIVYGDLLNAQNIAILVKGLEATVTTGGVRSDARRMRNKNDSTTATISWLGYNAPEDAYPKPHKWRAPNRSVYNDGRAKDGAKKLGAFMKELNLPASRNVTLVGHSYGSVVVGIALKRRLVQVDNVIVVGSPGMTVESASELHLDGVSMWAGAAPNDVVNQFGAFDTLPANSDFGAMPMPMSGSKRGNHPNGGHSSYFDDRTDSRDFMVKIIRGDYQRQCFSASNF